MKIKRSFRLGLSADFSLNTMTLDYTQFFSLESFKHRDLFEKKEVWKALSSLSEYMDSCTYSRPDHLPKDVYIENLDTVQIGKYVTIEPGAYIKGPAITGDHSIIRHSAYIREYSLIGSKCVVGHCSEIKHSIMIDGSAASHFAYVGDSILGNEVNLGAGVKCANLRLDKASIFLKVDGKKIDTNLYKLGAIIGDGCQIGCNSVLNPGTFLYKGVMIPPLKKVSGILLPKERSLSC